jgi:pyocin large subunit-like protein
MGIRSNGDIVRYNPITDAFGVMDAAGAPRTFFKPDPIIHGYLTNLDYFHAQFGSISLSSLRLAS